MKKNKREEDEEIRRAKANIRTGFIIAVIALTLFAVVAIVMISLMSALGSSGICSATRFLRNSDRIIEKK